MPSSLRRQRESRKAMNARCRRDLTQKRLQLCIHYVLLYLIDRTSTCTLVLLPDHNIASPLLAQHSSSKYAKPVKTPVPASIRPRCLRSAACPSHPAALASAPPHIPVAARRADSSVSLAACRPRYQRRYLDAPPSAEPGRPV